MTALLRDAARWAIACYQIIRHNDRAARHTRPAAQIMPPSFAEHSGRPTITDLATPRLNQARRWWWRQRHDATIAALTLTGIAAVVWPVTGNPTAFVCAVAILGCFVGLNHLSRP
ncbi:MAG: hypothetical protein AAF567_24375 [Actinomycetota bacterium]